MKSHNWYKYAGEIKSKVVPDDTEYVTEIKMEKTDLDPKGVEQSKCFIVRVFKNEEEVDNKYGQTYTVCRWEGWYSETIRTQPQHGESLSEQDPQVVIVLTEKKTFTTLVEAVGCALYYRIPKENSGFHDVGMFTDEEYNKEVRNLTGKQSPDLFNPSSDANIYKEMTYGNFKGATPHHFMSTLESGEVSGTVKRMILESDDIGTETLRDFIFFNSSSPKEEAFSNQPRNLSSTEYKNLRLMAIMNPATPPEILGKLLVEEYKPQMSPSHLTFIASDPRTPPLALGEILKSGNDDPISRAIEENPNTPIRARIEHIVNLVGNGRSRGRSIPILLEEAIELIEISGFTPDVLKLATDLVFNVSRSRHNADVERLTDMVFSNNESAEYMLSIAPKSFFDNIGMTQKNREIVEEYFKQPELTDEQELIQDIFSNRKNWFSKSQVKVI